VSGERRREARQLTCTRTGTARSWARIPRVRGAAGRHGDPQPAATAARGRLESSRVARRREGSWRV